MLIRFKIAYKIIYTFAFVQEKAEKIWEHKGQHHSHIIEDLKKYFHHLWVTFGFDACLIGPKKEKGSFQSFF